MPETSTTPDVDAVDKTSPVGNPEKNKKQGPDTLAMTVTKRWEAGTRDSKSALIEFMLNQAFADGEQWLWWNEQANRIDRIPRDDGRPRPTFNRYLSNSATNMSKLMQRELTFEVMLQGADDSHVRGARLGKSLLENVRTAHSWEQKREQANWACWLGGISAVCVEWDKNAGDPAAAPDDTGGVQRKQGDTLETVLNISEFVVEPGAKNAETARWWVRCQLLPPKEVQATYNLSWTPETDSLWSGTPYLIRPAFSNSEPPSPMTKVLTLYERPNSLSPKGKVVVVVNEQTIWSGDWPFPWTSHLNIACQTETLDPTKWYGRTRATAARSVQVFYNQANANIEEHMKKAAQAKLAVTQSSVDMMEDFQNDVDIFPYPDGTEKPGWIDPAQLPQWVIERPDRLSEVLDDIMGVHDVSRGEAPINIESGYGLSILAEHDATPINRLSKEQATCWSKVASMVLKLYEQEVKEPKRKTVVSTAPGQAPIDLEWSGKDFRGQTTAVVPPDAIIPRSRAAQMENARQMVEMGLVTSVADFMAVANMPDADFTLNALAPAISRARTENARFGTGVQSEVYEWDDHEIHIVEHNKYRMSVDYEMLKPEWKLLIEEHVQAHVTSEAERLGKQQMAGAIGGPGLAGAPTAAGAAMDPAMNPPFTGIEVPPVPMPEGPTAAEVPLAEAEQTAAAGDAASRVFDELMAAAEGPDLV